MNSTSFGPFSGLLTGLSAAVASALSDAPWLAVGLITAMTCVGLPLTGMILHHIRQRRGDLLDEKFAAALGEIPDPERRIQAIIYYRQIAARLPPKQPPEELPGSPPAPDPEQDSS